MRAALTAAVMLATVAACAQRAHESPARTAENTGLRFAIELRGPTAVAYVLDRSSGDQPGWLRITHQGRPVALLDRCEVANCGSPGGVCGATVPSFIRLDRASDRNRVEFVWDRTWSVVDEPQQCERREPAPAGEYVARFCYATAIAAPVEGEQFPRLRDPVCTERVFSIFDAEVVVLP